MIAKRQLDNAPALLPTLTIAGRSATTDIRAFPSSPSMPRAARASAHVMSTTSAMTMDGRRSLQISEDVKMPMISCSHWGMFPATAMFFRGEYVSPFGNQKVPLIVRV